MSLMVTYEAYKQIKNGIYGGRYITGTRYHYTYRTVIVPDTVKPAIPAKSASTLSKEHRKSKLKKKLEARLGKGKILQAKSKGADEDGYSKKSRQRSIDNKGNFKGGSENKRDKWYEKGNDKNFKRFCHRRYKKQGIKNLSPELIEELYEEYISLGKPRV